MSNIQLLTVLAGWLLGIWLINPDDDHEDSIPRNRWFIFKFIFKPFTHRGILHKEWSWLGLLAISMKINYVYYVNIHKFNFNIEVYYLVAAIVASSILHIITDELKDTFIPESLK